jgi:hypothetical protein
MVPIKNKDANLVRCLASVRRADEVFVVDSRDADSPWKSRSVPGPMLCNFNATGLGR